MGTGMRLPAEKWISVASNTLSSFVALMMTRSPTAGTLEPFGLLSSLYRVFLLTRTSTDWPLGVLTSTWVALMAIIVPSTCWSVPWAKLGVEMKRYMGDIIRHNLIVNPLFCIAVAAT